MIIGAKILSILACVLCASGCFSQPPPTVGAIIGKYSGSYAGAVEEFEILPNGRFTQVLSIGKDVIYKNKGTWGIDGEFIVFYNAYRALELSDPVIKRPPEIMDGLSGLWVDGNDEDLIVFDVDKGFEIRKSK